MPAQTPEEPEAECAMTADRPGYGVGAAVVDRGTLQLETGVNIDWEGGARTIALGTPLLRYGLARGVELRFAGSGYLREPAGASSAYWRDGLEDAAAGAKWQFTRQHGWMPALGTELLWTFPTGTTPSHVRKAEPLFRVMGEHTIGDAVTVGANGLWVREGGLREGRWITGAAMAVSVAISPRVSVFAEGFSLREPVSGWLTLADAGASYQATGSFALDVSVTHRVGPLGPDWCLNYGLSIRRKARDTRP
jgi:hypothetical protein